MGLKVNIPRDVHDKVMYWVNKSNEEVSGFGTVTVEGDQFHIVDAFLLKQKVGAAHTDIDAEALSKLQYQVFKDKVEGELKWWWHSHVKMDVFWSGTDKTTIRELGIQGWILASVFNQKSEIRSAFCGKAEVPIIGTNSHFIDELETDITNYYDNDELAQWDKDFKECVEDNKFTPKLYDERWQYRGLYHGAETLTGSRPPTSTRSDDKKNMKIIMAEAKLLNMKPKEYLRIIENGSWQEQQELDEKIFQLEQKGLVPNGYFY